MGWISFINRLGRTPLPPCCSRQPQFSVAIDGNCAEVFLRLYQIVQYPRVPPTPPVPCPSPKSPRSSFPRNVSQPGGAGPGKRAGRRRRRTAKTPSTQSYPASSHAQLVSEVRTTILNQISFGNNGCGKVAVRCSVPAFNLGDEWLLAALCQIPRHLRRLIGLYSRVFVVNGKESSSHLKG